jgi:RNA polymerase sigma-70 factor (ECF subfamily)
VRSRTVAPASDEVTERAAIDPGESVALRMLLDALDGDRREAFVLTQLVGLSYAEAADVCGRRRAGAADPGMFAKRAALTTRQ